MMGMGTNTCIASGRPGRLTSMPSPVIELDRFPAFNRGTLNEAKTGIAGTPRRQQDWTLDHVGNWAAFAVKTEGAAVLTQTRTHNKANELTGTAEAAEQAPRGGVPHPYQVYYPPVPGQPRGNEQAKPTK